MCKIDTAVLISSKGLKVTRQRLAVLACFGDGDLAVTHHDIQQIVAKEMDRVSLYRILELFAKKMIVFRLADCLGFNYYILNHFNLSNGDLVSLRKCEHCHKVSAIPSPPESYIKILKEYHIQPQLLFNGLCDQCNHD